MTDDRRPERAEQRPELARPLPDPARPADPTGHDEIERMVVPDLDWLDLTANGLVDAVGALAHPHLPHPHLPHPHLRRHRSAAG